MVISGNIKGEEAMVMEGKGRRGNVRIYKRNTREETVLGKHGKYRERMNEGEI